MLCRWSRAWYYRGVDISNWEKSVNYEDKDMEDSESCEDFILDSEDKLDDEQSVMWLSAQSYTVCKGRATRDPLWLKTISSASLRFHLSRITCLVIWYHFPNIFSLYRALQLKLVLIDHIICVTSTSAPSLSGQSRYCMTTGKGTAIWPSSLRVRAHERICFLCRSPNNSVASHEIGWDTIETTFLCIEEKNEEKAVQVIQPTTVRCTAQDSDYICSRAKM